MFFLMKILKLPFCFATNGKEKADSSEKQAKPELGRVSTVLHFAFCDTSLI